MQITTDRPTGVDRTRAALLLGALSAFPAVTIDIYLPGMPAMARDLDASAGLVQLTVTVFVVGLALGQLVVGPLSDVLGRRPLLLGGVALYVVGSLGCLLAPTVEAVVAARVAQALGAAAAAVLCRAVVRDLYEGAEMSRFLSSLMTINGLATVAAPVVGGELLRWAPWRSVFVVLVVLGTALLVAVVLGLPETLAPADRRPARLRATVDSYVALARDGAYVRHVVTVALMFAAVFVYIASSSFVLQEGHGLSPQAYGAVFAGNAVGIVVLSQLNSALLGRGAGETALLRVWLLVALGGGLGVLVCTATDAPLGWLLVSLLAVVSPLGAVMADGTSLALARHGGDAGSASSALGVTQFALAGLVASVVGLAGEGSAVAMGWGITASVAAALAVQRLGVRAHDTPA